MKTKSSSIARSKEGKIRSQATRCLGSKNIVFYDATRNSQLEFKKKKPLSQLATKKTALKKKQERLDQYVFSKSSFAHGVRVLEHSFPSNCGLF